MGGLRESATRWAPPPVRYLLLRSLSDRDLDPGSAAFMADLLSQQCMHGAKLINKLVTHFTGIGSSPRE